MRSGAFNPAPPNRRVSNWQARMRVKLPGLVDFIAMLAWIAFAMWPATAAFAGKVLPNSFAWGENVGWLNALPLGPSGPGLDVTNNELSGYAWGENIGWVSLSCQNTGSCGSASFGVTVDSLTGVFSGFAWGENVGWISFSCTNTATCNSVPFGVTAISPPTIATAFGAATIPLNGTTSLTFTVTNNNATAALTGVGFTDTLPAGLVIVTPNGLTGSCGVGTITATAGANVISLSGGTLAPSALCTFSVNITGTTAGVKNNTTGVISSTESGLGATSNTAAITVVSPPTIAKVFGAPTIPLNGTTSLMFTVTHNNTTVALTGVGVSDALPAGLVVAAPNGLTGSCGGGTITAVAGSSLITLAGATIPQSGSCTFLVNVTGTVAGDKVNTSGNVTSANGGTGNTANATIAVLAPPTIAKAFAPILLTEGNVTTLTFTLTNPAGNTVPLTGVGFTDILPVGIGIAIGSFNACGGTVTNTGPGSIVLAGATIAVNGTCQFSVTVFDVAIGTFVNASGNVTSTNGGTGGTASATLTVVMRPLIPTLSGWAVVLLSALLAFAALGYLRKRQG
jgi:uncharacterized repeat protein (TIGR01451 family)